MKILRLQGDVSGIGTVVEYTQWHFCKYHETNHVVFVKKHSGIWHASLNDNVAIKNVVVFECMHSIQRSFLI